MSNQYLYNEKELKSVYGDWSFAASMQTSARNPMWKNKTGLWALLSAACDEAAAQQYEYLNKFSNNLIDIDTCNIEALKSIAESVDLGYLCKNLNFKFPIEIMNLINLFSIPSYALLNKNEILSEDANEMILGSITERASSVYVEDIAIDIIFDIISNVDDIRNILNKNMVFTFRSIKDLLKTDLFDLALDSNNEILDYTLDDILNNIASINGILTQVDLSIFTKQKLDLGNDIKNWFYILINVIKQNLYNEEYDYFLVTYYFSAEKNETVDLTMLFNAIINVISSDNKAYIKDFICYHFNSLIKSKLKNDNIRSMFNYRKGVFYFNKEIVEYDYNEFLKNVDNYLSQDEIDKLLNPKYTYNETEDSISLELHLNNYILDFGKYEKCLNQFIEKYNKINGTSYKLDYNILKVNFSDTQVFKNDNYDDILFSNENNLILAFSKELTDISLNIQYIREQIKTSIQQFNFIGTKRIATDIFTDFFIKNYSDEKDWNYISDLSVSGIASSMFTPLSALLGSYDESKKFSIDVIEYYDQTKYLNIESDLGSALIENRYVRTDKSVEYILDDDNNPISTIVSSDIYEDVYVPCSYFVDDYNERFWHDKEIVIGSVNSDNITTNDSYKLLFSQYSDSLSLMTNENDKNNFIENSLKPLLDKLWDMHALSGYDSSYEGEFYDLFRKYIGNDDGLNKYKNISNKYFPTIAPIQSIENLIPTDSINDFEILYLAILYYSGKTLSSLKYNTRKIVEMHDENGIPYEDWHQNRISFHGYSSNYEYSDNTSILCRQPNSIIDFDGPWSYSSVQKALFNFYNGNDDFTFLTKYTNIEDNEVFSISGLYDYYFKNGKNENPILTDYLSGKNIFKIENDIYENTFTLFKNDDEFGKILFRSSDMPISLPLFNMNTKYSMIEIGDTEDIEIISSLIENCFDFGVINDVMWLFGKSKDYEYDKKFCLTTFKYSYYYNHIFINSDTIKYYYDNEMHSLNSLNDFIGATYDQDKNIMNMYIFNSSNELLKLNEDNTDIFNYTMSLTNCSLDLEENKLSNSSIEIKNAAFPMILNENDPHDFNNDHKIWKIERYDNKDHICYEALNNELDSSNFDYYKGFNLGKINIEIINLKYQIKNYLISDKNEYIYTKVNAKEYLYIKKKNNISILYNKNLCSFDELSVNLKNKIKDYPECNVENGYSSIDISPISFLHEFDEDILLNIASSVISKLSSLNENTISFDFINDNFNDIFNKNEFKSISSELDMLSGQNEYLINELKDDSETSGIINFTFKNKDQLDEGENENLANDLFKKVYSSNKCFYENLKIVVWFKNETNITFINDYALDADITCYIDDIIENKKKIGYGNRYKSSRYISWNGDVTKGEFEYLELKTNKYIKNNPDESYPMRIILNVCWHNASEIKTSNIYATILYHGIKQDIPLDVIGLSEKSCDTKSLILNIDKQYRTLTYEIPHNYIAIKLILKHELKNYDNGIPDIKIGLENFTESGLSLLSENNNWYKFDDYWLYYKHKDDEEYQTATILMDTKVYTVNESLIKEYLKETLNTLFGKKYKKLLLDEIYFGINNNEIDKNTSFSYIMYSFLNSNKIKNNEYYPILYEINASIRNNIIKLQNEVF